MNYDLEITVVANKVKILLVDRTSVALAWRGSSKRPILVVL
jgi:hypothetical protein